MLWSLALSGYPVTGKLIVNDVNELEYQGDLSLCDAAKISSLYLSKVAECTYQMIDSIATAIFKDETNPPIQ